MHRSPPGGIMRSEVKALGADKEEAHTLATAGRGNRRHPTCIIEPLWLPLALDPSLPLGATTTSNRYLHGLSTGHRRSRSRSRIVDDESVELLGHHHCLCAQPSCRSAWGSRRSDCRSTSP